MSLTVPECTRALLPVRDALDVIGGKWKLPIIVALTYGPRRFNQMEREIEGITPKMLSKELKDLELNQLVSRTVYDTMPVTVEYELTAHGKSLETVIGALYEWGRKHRKKVIGKE